MPPPAATIVIPTRLGSTRFPGKALVAETGRPLVLHVADRAAQATTARRIIVAAPDPEILEVVSEAGFEAMETREDHPNGTSRLAEVVEQLGTAPDERPGERPFGARGIQLPYTLGDATSAARKIP